MSHGPAAVTESSQRPVMASFLGANRMHRRPVAAGGGVAIGAGIPTWFFIVWLIGRFHAGEFDVQAATGLPSLIVLLTVMNWFFHKIYWTGWISHHHSADGASCHPTPKPQRRTLLGLALLLEARQDLPGVHALLDDLDRHAPLDRLGLLGHPDRPHAAFADLLQQLVGTDDGARAFGDGRLSDRANQGRRRRFQETTYLGLSGQEALDALAQLRVRGAHDVQVRGPFGGSCLLRRRQKDGVNALLVRAHSLVLVRSSHKAVASFVAAVPQAGASRLATGTCASSERNSV